jgi:tetratricopeptide (TPR) repeat protein
MPRFVPAISTISLLALALLALPTQQSAVAQVGRDSIPSQRYYGAFNLLHEGQYRDALNVFSDEGRGGIKTAQSRWIDSICYHTMIGECHYQMGNLAQALPHFTSALELQVAFADWMIRAQFPPGIQVGGAGSRVAVPWGASKRPSKVGQFSTSYMMSQGRINNNEVVQRGGVVQQAQLFPVHISEIVRATCLSMRRRREILGPTCKHDPITAQVLGALQRKPGVPNHWSQAWIEVQLGAAQVSMSSYAQAASTLERSILAAGEFDHPLSATAMFELGRLALEAGDFRAAARLFEETTYSAVNFLDLTLLEEAFRLGFLTHVMSGAKGPYPPLVPALAWAKQKGYRALQASLAQLAAENAAVLGNPAAAATFLGEFRTSGGRSDLANSATGARANFTAALVASQQGNFAAADQALALVSKYQLNGSFWMFHIGLVDRSVVSRTLDSDRIAMQLYETVLRDPTPADWSTSPMESLTVLTTPHPLPYEHWFETSVRRAQDRELAVEIADRARRHRYFSTLPLGGRIMALRWVLEAPDDLLDNQQTLQRQELLARFPVCATAMGRIKELEANLAQLPAVPIDEADKKRQATLLSDLANANGVLEKAFREIALRREPADMLFPPLRRTRDVQAALPDKTLLLVFFATTRGTYGFLFSKENYATWPLNNAVPITKQLQLTLRDLGNFEQNHQIGPDQLASADWKKNAVKLRNLMFDKSKVDLAADFDELIIVPDGISWYLPWEALPVGADETPLIHRVRVRYAPTVGLSLPYTSRPLASRNVGVLAGKLFPQDKPEVSQAAFQKLQDAVPDALLLDEVPPGATSLFRKAFDQLVVLDDIKPAGAYDWSPLQTDRTKPAGTLAAWMQTPTGGPDVLVLPGFHTMAENSLKTKKGGGNGSELFLSSLGLMSSGVRTMLLSRWRVGGQSSTALVREFMQELPHTTPADAWQRSVLLLEQTAIDADAEPRVRRSSAAKDPMTAEHPFFWAGYVLVDMGAPNTKPTADAPVAAGAPGAPGAAGLPPLAIPPDDDDAGEDADAAEEEMEGEEGAEA